MFFPIGCARQMLSHICGGDEEIRTLDPLLAGQVLSQLSYTPVAFSFSGFLSDPENRTTIDLHRTTHTRIFSLSPL